MISVADSIGIRSHGMAGTTLAALDLGCARICSLVRLGFPSLVDEADAGASVVTVRLASGDEGSTHHFAIARVATELSIRPRGAPQ